MAAREIHSSAEISREGKEYLASLKYGDEAMIQYQKENDKLGMAEVLASRFLTLKHLYRETGDKDYLSIGKYTLLAAIDIAEKSGNPEAVALPYFHLGECLELLEDRAQAITFYQKAVENMQNHPPSMHNKEATICNMIVHLSFNEYHKGDKKALKRAEAALKKLASLKMDNYTQDAWLSGGYMRLAEVVYGDNKELTQEYLTKAKKIIDQNEKLVIRSEQYADLVKRLI